MDEAMQRLHQAVARDKTKREAFNAFIKSLLDGATQHHDAMTGTTDGDVRERQEAFLDVIHFAVRYAGACAKDHEGSAGMRTKMRTELRLSMRRWCQLRSEK